MGNYERSSKIRLMNTKVINVKFVAVNVSFKIHMWMVLNNPAVIQMCASFNMCRWYSRQDISARIFRIQRRETEDITRTRVRVSPVADGLFKQMCQSLDWLTGRIKPRRSGTVTLTFKMHRRSTCETIWRMQTFDELDAKHQRFWTSIEEKSNSWNRRTWR